MAIDVIKKLREHYEEYEKHEREINLLKRKLPNYGNFCDCGNPTFFLTRDKGDDDEIIHFCGECGGEEVA